MSRMAKGQRAVQRERLSEKVAELQASTGATTTGTSADGGDGKTKTLITFKK